mmetsp:Transcript_16150/g.46734  ORF Transcript_16150/g.46734 Transcript_16150/m.46734 type:complete len:234 (-) Transcript_16150:142-843(-)
MSCLKSRNSKFSTRDMPMPKQKIAKRKLKICGLRRYLSSNSRPETFAEPTPLLAVVGDSPPSGMDFGSCMCPGELTAPIITTVAQPKAKVPMYMIQVPKMSMRTPRAMFTTAHDTAPYKRSSPKRPRSPLRIESVWASMMGMQGLNATALNQRLPIKTRLRGTAKPKSMTHCEQKATVESAKHILIAFSRACKIPSANCLSTRVVRKPVATMLIKASPENSTPISDGSTPRSR